MARVMNEMGFYWARLFLVRYAHETRESIEETERFIEEIDPPFVTVARFTPIPGTPFYNELEAAGRIHPGIDWSCETNQRLGERLRRSSMQPGGVRVDHARRRRRR